MYLMLQRSVSLLLVSLILLMGCAYTPKITKPENTDNKAEWVKYYKDQFRAYGSNVTAPSDTATDVEKSAYQEARSSWVKGRIWGYVLSGVLLAISIGLLVTTISQASSV